MNPKLAKWEERLHAVLHSIDSKLEDKYGEIAPLHPARPARGETANPQYDGLFRVTAPFTAGYGSELGAGYIFRVEFASLSHIPPAIAEKVKADAVAMLKADLKHAFPGKKLHVDKDGDTCKIHGDITLD